MFKHGLKHQLLLLSAMGPLYRLPVAQTISRSAGLTSALSLVQPVGESNKKPQAHPRPKCQAAAAVRVPTPGALLPSCGCWCLLLPAFLPAGEASPAASLSYQSWADFCLIKRRDK